jgi:Rieske 2Fe-2S family protein
MSSRSYRHGWFAPMEDDSLDIRRWVLPRLMPVPRSTADGQSGA